MLFAKDLYLWNTKSEFLEAVANGAMSKYDLEHDLSKKKLVYDAVVHILSTDYQTPLINERKNNICISVFENHVDTLFALITKSQISNLSPNPPDYQTIERNQQKGRSLIKSLNDTCSDTSTGQKLTYTIFPINPKGH